MKNRKLIKTVAASIVCSAMALTAFSFAACNSGNGDGGETEGPHYHTYSSGDDWAYDGTNHWRYATCGHDELTMGVAPHTWEGESCSVCGATKKLIKPTMTEADEGTPEYDADGNMLVNYEFFPQDYDAATYADDLVAGIFTVVKSTEIRTRTRTELYDENGNKIKDVDYSKSVKLGNGGTVKIKAPAAGKLTIHVQNGSSGGLTTQKLNLTKPSGETSIIEYRAVGSVLQLVEVDCDAEGVYTLQAASGTSDAFYISYSAKVKDSPVESIGVASAGNVNYFVGQEFSIDGLSVNATHETTGRISPIDSRRLLIDYTSFNSTKSGTYKIGVSYTKAGHTYETSYNVNVYAFDGLTLGTDKIVKEKTNTSAGNGVYANHSLRQFYFTGETLSTDGISVILNGSIGTTAQDFLLKESAYTVSDVDLSTAGKKSVTVSYTTGGVTKSKTFDIFVAEKDASLATATSVELSVDPATTDANVGVKSGDSYQFQTIHQALEFLENSGVPANAAKTINLAAGTYWEKLEVKVPNLTIIGAGRDTTKIEYDALYGVKDAGGFEHTTDSTATLNVREAAQNFTIKGVTVSNYYNSVESYVGAPSSDCRALAILIQSDKFVMDECALLGYQDTIELFTGRQLITNTYISGTTDFIFGTNNTTYFYNCEIHSITNGKTDGGYITAFKGNNKDGNDAVAYGAIFDKCHFTADAEVVANGNTAIGRPWGAYAAVAVINSEIDGHVSKAGFEGNGNSKNLRYVSMNAKPTDSTVKFVEYNNTGAGAIDTAVGGMTMLTSTDAAKYSDLSVIFATKNGGVSYSSVWVPVLPGMETHTVMVYTDDGTELGTLNVANGTALLEDQIKGLVTANDAYKLHDIVGIYSDESCLTEYTYPEISADGNVYVKLHFETAFVANGTISFGTAGNYKDYLGTKLIATEVAGQTTIRDNGGNNSQLGNGVTLSINVKAGATVSVSSYASYTHYTVKIDDELYTADEVTATSWSYTATADCKVTFVSGANNYFYNIDVSYPVNTDTTIDLLEFTGTVQGNSTTWNGIEIDATNGKFAKRDTDIQVNATTILKLKVGAGANVEVVEYNGVIMTTNGTVVVEDGVATITITANCFIKAINITY